MAEQKFMAQNSDIYMMYAAELGLCLKELDMTKSFVEDVLRKMALQLREEKDKGMSENKRLSYYAQLTHSVILNLQAVENSVSALSLLMAQNNDNI
ncbi:sensor histidine kinase [Prevotella sp. MGM1]|nr:sensor histidine kinase [Prevotella sp. MGM1]